MNAAPVAIPIDRYVTTASAVIAVIALVLLPFYEADQQGTLFAHGVLVFALVALSAFIRRTGPARPTRLPLLVLFFGLLQPVALLISTLLQGDVSYNSYTLGVVSHHRETLHVAVVYGVFFLAFSVGVVVASFGDRAPSPSWTALTTSLSPLFVNVAVWAAVAAAVIRLGLLFSGVEATGSVVAYVARLYIAYFVPLTFFLGWGFRKRYRSALVAAPIAGVVYALVLFSGSRGDALVPAAFGFIGAMIAAPMPRRRVVIWMLVGGLAGGGAMFLGELLRGDELGRTGDAALQRLSDVGERFDQQDEDRDDLQLTTVRRYLRNSTHAVLTYIPTFLPYEDEGLERLPADVARSLVPGFNLLGRSDDDLPRNWMLNQLGFLVTWQTSVELSLVADAWYRGGLWGIVLIGLATGVLLQVVERLIYVCVRIGPEWQCMLLFAFVACWMFEGKDFAHGCHTLLFSLTAGALFVLFVRVLARVLAGTATRARASIGVPIRGS